MNKEKFLESLRKKLSILEESEIEDILNEYEGYIEEKITKGSSEKDAVKSMGNIDELASELLSAYKVKSTKDKATTVINNIADEIIKIFEQIVDVFSQKNFDDILKFFLELIFILICIAFCKIPFVIIETIGDSIFSSLGHFPYRLFSGLWSFILELVYLIFSVLLFIKIFKSRLLNNFVDKTVEELKKEPNNQSKSNKKTTNNEKEKTNIPETKKKDIIIKENNHKTKETNFNLVDNLTKICLIPFKFLAFFLLISVIFLLIGLSIAFGIAICLIFEKIFYLGFLLVLISLFVLGILAFLILFNFIFDRKSNLSILLIITIASFIVLGLGVSVSAVELAQNSIVYNEQDLETGFKKEGFIFDMRDNLVINTNSYWQFIIDENLKDTIKVEYSYNDTYFKVNANPYIANSSNYTILYPSYTNTSFTYSKTAFDNFINNLKQKKIIIPSFNQVDIKIYISSANKQKVEDNYLNYYNSNYNYYDHYNRNNHNYDNFHNFFDD